LPPIDAPTLLLWGLDDAYLTYELGRRGGAFVDGPFALQALTETGHWIQQERPDEVNELLLAFLGTDFG
jgi:pimeloyl-ACP methyl ester carboxylesterase